MSVSDIIYDAAIRSYVTEARNHVARALKIDGAELADALLPDQATWTRASVAARATAIGSWLMAECAAVADQSQRLVIVADPLHVVGTRD